MKDKSLVALIISLLSVGWMGCGGTEVPPPAKVQVTTVPETVYTVVEGVPKKSGDTAETQDLSWLFHLAFESREDEPLSFDEAHISFKRGEKTLWHEALPRKYLESMEWIEGAYQLDTGYFLDNVMFGKEVATEPELPAGERITWIRIPFVRPAYADVDNIHLMFHLRNAQGELRTLEHSISLTRHEQKARLRLPFSGTWAVLKGNDVNSGHRRTGFRNLTTMGWDFAKADEESFGESVLAAGDGVVVDVRNDIEDYGRGARPARELLEEDGDVFAGNLVTIDHGNSEYTLTCHLLPGSVTVDIGDRVNAGQVIGKVGKAGLVHFNMMNDGEWLKAHGVPSLFSDFERVLPGIKPQRITRGNPRTGWLVAPVEGKPSLRSD